MNLIRLLTLAAAIYSNQATAEPLRPVDVEQFDVAGVRLGMSRSEAVTAISEKLELGKHDVQFEPFPQENVVTKTKEPRYFMVKKGHAEVTVSLSPRIPYDKSRPMAVFSITYKQPPTPQNESAMRSAAIEKYGPPTDHGSSWCLRPHPNPGIACSQVQENGPTLLLVGSELVLNDHRYFQELINYINMKQSGKPAF
ncbi:MAG: hypothetical protein RLZZ298_2077 [Pseudomonadota bacterium]|jgi:hypothetical protein